MSENEKPEAQPEAEAEKAEEPVLLRRLVVDMYEAETRVTYSGDAVPALSNLDTRLVVIGALRAALQSLKG